MSKAIKVLDEILKPYGDLRDGGLMYEQGVFANHLRQILLAHEEDHKKLLTCIASLQACYAALESRVAVLEAEASKIMCTCPDHKDPHVHHVAEDSLTEESKKFWKGDGWKPSQPVAEKPQGVAITWECRKCAYVWDSAMSTPTCPNCQSGNVSPKAEKPSEYIQIPRCEYETLEEKAWKYDELNK